MKRSAIIIDDEVAGIKQLHRLLQYIDEIEVVAQTSIVEEAIELITIHKPDIIFLDVEMPRMSGFEIVEITRNQGLNPDFIFTTAHSQYAIKAIKVKAYDYLLKPISLEDLKEVLNRMNRESIPNESYTSMISKELSERELEILYMIVQGRTSKEIANKLFISKTTVDTHRRNIIEKTQVKSTSELISKMHI